MDNIYYMSPTKEILLRMEMQLAEMLKDLELLRLESSAMTSQHPSLTERTDEEAE
jgi:hypothetical protein